MQLLWLLFCSILTRTLNSFISTAFPFSNTTSFFQQDKNKIKQIFVVTNAIGNKSSIYFLKSLRTKNTSLGYQYWHIVFLKCFLVSIRRLSTSLSYIPQQHNKVCITRKAHQSWGPFSSDKLDLLPVQIKKIITINLRIYVVGFQDVTQW